MNAEHGSIDEENNLLRNVINCFLPKCVRTHSKHPTRDGYFIFMEMLCFGKCSPSICLVSICQLNCCSQFSAPANFTSFIYCSVFSSQTNSLGNYLADVYDRSASTWKSNQIISLQLNWNNNLFGNNDAKCHHILSITCSVCHLRETLLNGTVLEWLFFLPISERM